MSHTHNINKELNEKLRLKRVGHSLIDQIKWKGYSKDEVYALLAREMGIDEEHAHFARMQSMRSLRAAVGALERILAKVPKTQYAAGKKRPVAVARVIKTEPKKAPVVLTPPKPVKKRVNKRTKDVLPRDQMLKALEELKSARTRLLAQVDDLEPDSQGILERIKQYLHEKIFSKKAKQATDLPPAAETLGGV